MVKNFVHIYIVGNLGYKHLTQPKLIHFSVAEVRTKPIFLIHGLCVQETGTRQTVPSLLLAPTLPFPNHL